MLLVSATEELQHVLVQTAAVLKCVVDVTQLGQIRLLSLLFVNVSMNFISSSVHLHFHHSLHVRGHRLGFMCAAPSGLPEALCSHAGADSNTNAHQNVAD